MIGAPPAQHSGLDAASVLAALSDSWVTPHPITPEPAANAAPPPKVDDHGPQPLPETLLSLRAVPQIAYEDAQPLFPVLKNQFPQSWKEQIRELRTKLCVAQAEADAAGESLQTLAFTSVDGGRARHGLVGNLALALASIVDTRVLWIDCNFNHPSLHESVQIPIAPGFCEATRSGKDTLPACFRRVMGTQIYFAPAGQVFGSSFDPIDLRGMYALLRSLRPQFDWILLDGPGFDSPADAIAVSNAADGIVVMVEKERDTFRDVSRMLAPLEGRPVLGAIML